MQLILEFRWAKRTAYRWIGSGITSPLSAICENENIFLHLSVIHSVHRGGEEVCLSACWDTTPPEQTPPRSRPPPQQIPPPGSRLQHTVYERLVRILLECILVLHTDFTMLLDLLNCLWEYFVSHDMWIPNVLNLTYHHCCMRGPTSCENHENNTECLSQLEGVIFFCWPIFGNISYLKLLS